jgi:carbon-monoxide dehydrogenase large subunit
LVVAQILLLPQEAQLEKEISKLQIIGSSVKRKEDYRLLTGVARFVDDLHLPEMHYAKFVRSTHAHAKIRKISFDVHPSLGEWGELFCFDGSDLLKRFNPIVNVLPLWKQIKIMPLAVGKVRYVGEPVAVIVGRDRDLVEDAIEKVQIDYEELPSVLTVQKALEPDSPLLYEEWGTNLMGTERFESGNVESVFKDGNRIFKGRFVSHRYTGAPMETRGCLTTIDRATGILTLYTSTQWPHLLSAAISESLNHPQNKTRVIAPEVGGGFGVKNHFYNEEFVLSLLSLKTGFSIKWIESRSEHFVATNHAREQVHDIEVAIDKSGIILGIKDHVLGDLGAGSLAPYNGIGPVRVAAFVVPGAYKVRNYQCTIDCIVTNKTPAGAYRGFGQPEGEFAIERILDIAAQELRLDPLEFRLKNLVRQEDLPYTTATGNPLESGSFRESCELAAKLLGYPGFREIQRKARESGRYLGISIVPFIEGTAPTLFGQNGMSGGFDSAHVRMGPDGRVSVSTGVCSTGSGLETTLAQVASEVLNIPLEWITVTQGDSLTTPFGLGSWGSRSLVVAGGAVAMASFELRSKVLSIAGRIKGCPSAELYIDARLIKHRNGSFEPVPLSEIARVAYVDSGRLPPEVDPTLESSACFDPSLVVTKDSGRAQSRTRWVATVSNGAFGVVVQVDPETGIVKLLDAVIVDDCGRVVNPLIVEGQLHGGVAQGIGGALLEELRYDENGQLVSSTLIDYLLPTSTDLPNIRTAHIESPSSNVPFGFKGVGEAGVICPPVAIANAIVDALAPVGKIGIDVSHLKSEYVWKTTRKT